MEETSRAETPAGRLRVIGIAALLFGFLLIVRLFTLQVWQHELYSRLATGTHEVFRELLPERGSIYIKEGATGRTAPVALNRDVFSVVADTRKIADNEKAARAIDDAVHVGDAKRWDIYQNLNTHPSAAYVPLLSRITEDEKNALESKNVVGLTFERRPYRYYPEKEVGAHVVGFFGLQNDGTPIGRYGIEGYFNDELTGEQGAVRGERSAIGAWIPLGRREYTPAKNGKDITLTIDRTIQYEVCTDIARRALEFKAASAAAVVLDPKTGAVLALCSYPSFDPNEYNKVEDIRYFNNEAVFTAYEVGSIFKPLVMAAALDQDVITPDTTFEDTGLREFDAFKIRNAGNKTYGTQTMREVLVNSINTGMIFVAERLGSKLVHEYIRAFGFGKPTGIEIQTEAPGDINNLKKESFVYTATASFGQGITATPLQMARAYTALANAGTMVEPYIVEKIENNGKIVFQAEPDGGKEALSPRAAAMTADMMVSVVEDGHAKTARVSGYNIAGKTGTAQITEGSSEYAEGKTIHSFAGFGPIEDPKFVMVVKFDKPEASYAESTAAPVFGELAHFILQYMKVPPSQ